MGIDVKGIVAILVVAGSFGLLGLYVYHAQVPDATVAGIVGTALGLVLGFYFGHVNGVQTGLAQGALTLAQKAIDQSGQRRAGDAPVVSAPVTVVPPQGGNA